MATDVRVRLHPLVNNNLNGLAKLSELIRYLENEAPEAIADATADAVEAYAAGTLHKGYGLLTGTLKDSIEKKRVRGGKGYYRARVQTTATRGEQREAEYKMRGIPYFASAGRADDQGYAVFVENGSPGGRRPVPFMSHAYGVGAVYIRREAAESVRERIRDALSR